MVKRCTDLLLRLKIDVIPKMTGQPVEASNLGAMGAELQPRSSFHPMTLTSLKSE